MPSAAESRRQAKKVNYISPKKFDRICEKVRKETKKKTNRAAKWIEKNISKASKNGLFEVELYYSREKVFKLGRFRYLVLRKDYLLLDDRVSIHSVTDILESKGYGIRFVYHEKPDYDSKETRIEYQKRCSDSRRQIGPFDGYHINSIIISW